MERFVFSIRQILLLYVLQNWRISRISMRISRKSAARFILFPVTPSLFTKHGMILQKESERLNIR